MHLGLCCVWWSVKVGVVGLDLGAQVMLTKIRFKLSYVHAFPCGVYVQLKLLSSSRSQALQAGLRKLLAQETRLGESQRGCVGYCRWEGERNGVRCVGEVVVILLLHIHVCIPQ